MTNSADHFRTIISHFTEKRVLVIGDIMLDAYFWGSAERISPEAPVPIVEVKKSNYNPGGAGNVALNLAKLGANVSVLALIGEDPNGEILRNQLVKAGIDTKSLISDKTRRTAVKTRVIAQDQQVVRVDQEDDFVITDEIIDKTNDNLDSVQDYDGIILADYNKGLFTKKIIKNILKKAKSNSTPVYVDPKWDNFYEYQNVRLFKPNLQEFRQALGNHYSEDKFIEFGNKLRNELNSEILLITKGAEGATVFVDNSQESIPTKARRAYDVSGAGDTMIATFTLADLCGATPTEAANIANTAAGIVCEQVGVVPVATDILTNAF